MNCPYCGHSDTKVVDSRAQDTRIRRRRECIQCGKRFTTYEEIERPMLLVQKRSGIYEPFEARKVRIGILNAIKKRPITTEQVNAIIDDMENRFADEMRTTVTSAEIGNTVLEYLKQIDAVAYIRFASVYQDFTDVAGFLAAIGALGDAANTTKKGDNEHG